MAATFCCVGQQQNSMPIFQSPNASSLGAYGKYDISPFTGLANIDIDVFSLKEGDVPVNCKLSYFSGGVKPTQHPGWVGQNWTLNVGGVVTRKVNGDPDEIATSAALPDDKQFAYYYQYSVYNKANWYDFANMQSLFLKTFDGSSLARPTPLPLELAPDEFMFNLPSGVSGSFFKNHLGNWVVKTKGGDDLKVVVQTNTESPSYPNPFLLDNPISSTSFKRLMIKRVIYIIEITDQNGFKYTFGNDVKAIEFTRSGGHQAAWENFEDVVANAWYLTKIESRKGSIVNFNYIRSINANQYIQSVIYPSTSAVQIFQNGSSFFGSVLSTFTGHIISPSYLKSISSSSFRVDFNLVETTELKYSYQDIIANNARTKNCFGFLFFNFPDLEIANNSDPSNELINSISKWYKLTDIVVSDLNGGIKEKHVFEFNDNPSERLFLKKYKKLDLSLNIKDAVHQFTYNPIPLPEYSSQKNDRWGFFNERQFDLASADFSLAMDPIKAQAGSLTSIIYPTGGSTSFLYEPNDYSTVVTKTVSEATGIPIPSIGLVSETGIGGGLRIWKIINKDNFGAEYTTEYKYIKKPTNASSGILAGKKNLQKSFPTIGNPRIAQASFFDLNEYTTLDYTNGRDVVYSEVKKINPNGSYTIYHYANSDNPTYIDERPLDFFSFATFYDELNPALSEASLPSPPSASLTVFNSSNSNLISSHTSWELEKGQLLYEEDYEPTNNSIVHKIEYSYNVDPNRVNEFVRFYDRYLVKARAFDPASPGPVSRTAAEYYYQPIKIYTYYPYLANKTETFYNQTTGAPIQTVTNFTYGLPGHRQVKTINTDDSKNGLITVENIYNKDIVDGATLSGLTPSQFANLTSMYNTKGIITPIHVNRKLNSVLTSQERYNFNSNFLIDSYQSAVGSNALETKMLYSSYDSKGNVLELQKNNDVKHSYLWGYNYQYPIAEIENATYAQVVAILGQPVIDGFNTSPGTDDQMRLSLNALRVSPSLKDTRITTYTYNPLIGMTSKTDPNGVTTYYEYDAFGKLKNIKDKDQNIVKNFVYHYKN
jgi:YD repeat-containing protein